MAVTGFDSSISPDLLKRGHKYLPRYTRGIAVQNIVLLLLIFFFFSAGVVFLVMDVSLYFSLLATLMVAVSLIWSWYLSHDCAHGLVFKGRAMNTALGEMLAVINGVAYTPFTEYRRDHMEHHAKKVDIVGFDIVASLAQIPKGCSRFLLQCESVYLPACFYFIKWMTVKEQLRGSYASRCRVVAQLLFSTVLIVAIAYNCLLNLMFFMLAVFIRIHVVRFIDAFQHDFEQLPPSSAISPYDRNYEQRHTFSVPVARKWTPLNLCILNFGYHNAHHAMPACPWYALPELDTELFATSVVPVTFPQLLIAYHTRRTERICSTDSGVAYNGDNNFSLERFPGAYTDKLLG